MTSLPVMGWRDKAMHIHDFDLAFCVKSKLPGWEDLSPADVPLCQDRCRLLQGDFVSL